MDQLTKMPNLGRVNAQKLTAAGIDTPEKLREVGSREALRRVRAAVDPGACINMLYGLEAAILGIHKSLLPPEVKEELKAFYHTLE